LIEFNILYYFLVVALYCIGDEYMEWSALFLRIQQSFEAIAIVEVVVPGIGLGRATCCRVKRVV
jgi:hypothetical protein